METVQIAIVPDYWAYFKVRCSNTTIKTMLVNQL